MDSPRVHAESPLLRCEVCGQCCLGKGAMLHHVTSRHLTTTPLHSTAAPSAEERAVWHQEQYVLSDLGGTPRDSESHVGTVHPSPPHHTGEHGNVCGKQPRDNLIELHNKIKVEENCKFFEEDIKSTENFMYFNKDVKIEDEAFLDMQYDLKIEPTFIESEGDLRNGENFMDFEECKVEENSCESAENVECVEYFQGCAAGSEIPYCQLGCQHCSKSLSSEALLLRHIAEAHLESARFQCGACPFTSSQHLGVAQHWGERHTGPPQVTESTVVCKLCSTYVRNKTELQNHIRTQHAAELVCPVCKTSQLFAARCKLRAHVLLRHGEAPWASHVLRLIKRTSVRVRLLVSETEPGVPEQFRCFYCNRVRYTTRLGLYRHISTHHLSISPAQCTHCSFTSFCRRRMREHCMQTHATGIHHKGARQLCTRWNTCIECSPTPTRESLRVPVQRLPCPLCFDTKVFFGLSAWEQHLLSVHGAEAWKTYLYDVCKEAEITKCYLKKDTRTNLFQCYICLGHGFVSVHMLKLHIKESHLKMKSTRIELSEQSKYVRDEFDHIISEMEDSSRSRTNRPSVTQNGSAVSRSRQPHNSSVSSVRLYRSFACIGLTPSVSVSLPKSSKKLVDSEPKFFQSQIQGTPSNVPDQKSIPSSTCEPEVTTNSPVTCTESVNFFGVQINVNEQKVDYTIGDSAVLTQAIPSISDFMESDSWRHENQLIQEEDVKISQVVETRSGFPCYYCTENSSSRPILRSHVIQRHLKIRELRCAYCPKDYYTELAIQFHHTRRHIHENVPQKSVHKFPQTSQFQVVTVQPPAVSETSAEKDTAGVNTKRDNKTGESTRKEKTAALNKQTKDSEIFRREQQKIEEAEVLINAVVEKPGVGMECFYCHKFSPSRAILRSHVWMHHLQIRQFQCGLCDSQFYREDRVRRHHELLHKQSLLVIHSRFSVTQESPEPGRPKTE